ncbi:FAD-binding oxidoreductase [Streptomyces hirsutus]
MDMLERLGDPARAKPLPDTVIGLLRTCSALKPRPNAPVALGEVMVPEPRLEPAARRALAAALVRFGRRARAVARTAARATCAPTRRPGSGTPAASPPPTCCASGTATSPTSPRPSCTPASHDQVLAVLRACAEHGLAVVPFGGGTSVVGGLAPGNWPRPFVALDLRRMDRLLALDPVSRTATLQPGLRAPQAEALLGEHGFTLGHFPQSYEWATIGGFAATRSSGQGFAGDGRFDEMVLALTLATPEGTLDTGRAPRSAAGPDLRQLVLGSEEPSASSPRRPSGSGPSPGPASTRAGASTPSNRGSPHCAASPRPSLRPHPRRDCPTRPRR